MAEDRGRAGSPWRLTQVGLPRPDAASGVRGGRDRKRMGTGVCDSASRTAKRDGDSAPARYVWSAGGRGCSVGFCWPRTDEGTLSRLPVGHTTRCMQPAPNSWLLIYMSKWACRANPARTRSSPARIVPGLARHAGLNGPGRARPRDVLRAQARHGDPLNGPCRASSPVGLNGPCRPLVQITVKINYTNNVTAIRHNTQSDMKITITHIIYIIWQQLHLHT
jgi:hypothetical protein